MAAVQAAARKGGRTQQGKTPAPSRHAPGQFGPPKASPPAPAPGPVPRTGGRTQQGARAKSRTGGRTQQGGGNVKPGQPPASPPAPASSPATSSTRAPTSTRISTASREGSGALLVLFAYPMAFALLRGGPAGLRTWLKAKFINEPESAQQIQAGSGLGARKARKGGKR